MSATLPRDAVAEEAASAEAVEAALAAVERQRASRQRGLRLLLGALTPLGIVLVWWYLSANEIFPTYVLPGPVVVGQTLWRLIQSGEVWAQTRESFVRVLVGFAIAIVIGFPLGVALAVYPRTRDLLLPTVRFFYPIPGVAWVPLAILWFGLGFNALIFTIASSTVFPIIMTTFAGVVALDPTYHTVMQVFGTNRWLGFRRVLIPASLPFILAGLRLAYGVGWRVIISAEMIGATSGLGWMIDNARWQLRSDIVLAGMVVIGIIGLLVENVGFDLLERKTIGKWAG
jgi:ABC-type nitrate/sulfonate/bicarbonate transport system permease component